MYVLLVAEQLGINPLRREIWAFRGKGGVQPIVSIDGWKAIMLRQPSYDGYQVTYSDSMVQIEGIGSVPEWAECTIWLKGISHPTVERVFMKEVFVSKSPVWNKSPRLMLHHRALIQAIRFSFPVTGISDVGVGEGGEVIEADDLMNGGGVITGASKPALPQTPAVKPITLDTSKFDAVADKLIAMGRSRGDFAQSLAFVEQKLTGEARDYVKRRVTAAQEEDRRQAQANPVQEAAAVPDYPEDAPVF